MQSVVINFILLYYLNVTDSSIIQLIFILLSCREKAYDNKEFSRENSKPCVCVCVCVYIYIYIFVVYI